MINLIHEFFVQIFQVTLCNKDVGHFDRNLKHIQETGIKQYDGLYVDQD
jgi:hypothetical protein